ncbi:MAG TPA: hypothetical protein VIV11_41215 [Kofleriaceae bacterium]
MRRRDFIWLFGGGVVTCVVGCEAGSDDDHVPAADAATGGGSNQDIVVDAASIDACVQQVVKMHDTHAQALYLDGMLGPLTGIVSVAHVISSAAITMDFWHGHGGQVHRFTLQPTHFDALKRGERITVGTTTVDGHAHTLFIDPKDERYRVEGAPDVDVPLGC